MHSQAESASLAQCLGRHVSALQAAALSAELRLVVFLSTSRADTQVTIAAVVAVLIGLLID
jgi:hypothetical protein